MDDDLPECLACGACCFADQPFYVRVSGDDYARLGDVAEDLTTWQGTRCFMSMRAGRCAALELDAAAGRYTCNVYARRPETCRVLERGSPECAGERHTKSERARRALRVL